MSIAVYYLLPLFTYDVFCTVSWVVNVRPSTCHLFDEQITFQ